MAASTPRSTYLSSDVPNHSISRISMNSSPDSPIRSALTFHTKSPANRGSSSGSRQYGGMDKKPALAEFTTYYSQSAASTPHATTSFHDTTTSSGGTSGASSGGGNNGSVISAFRDLQNKVKIIEQERYDAIRERDQLRSMLIEKKRNIHIEKNKTEMETTESLIALHSQREKHQREHDEYLHRIRAQEEIHDSINRKLRSQQHLQVSLQDDVERNLQKCIKLEKNMHNLKYDVNDLQDRCQKVEETVTITSPSNHQKQIQHMKHKIDELDVEIMQAQAKNIRKRNKIQSIEGYIDLVIKINGELCDTLVAREEAKSRLVRMSRSLSPPPRYAWPKEVPYSSVIQVINEAARATAQAHVESTTLHATEQAMKNVIRAMTPPRRHQHLDVEDADSSSSDEPTRIYDSGSKRATSPFNATLNTALSSLSVHDNNKQPKRTINFESKLNGSDNESDSSESVREVTKKRFKKKKSKRKSHDSSNDGRSSIGHLVTTQKRKKSLQTMIARQGAITSATRLAAAAVAASTALKITHPTSSTVTNNTVSTSSKSRNKEDSANKVDFIPSSGSRSNEFNVVASVSKASRAAKTLNATIASKVKSIHSGGVGSIFDEVPRIELLDMQHQLAAVKKMRESLSKF